MNLFFCCVKRDKPVVSTNKPSKENLYNFVINDKLQNKKKAEDSDNKTITQSEENSNFSLDLNEKDVSKPHHPQEKHFEIPPGIDTESEEHFEYLFYERGLTEEWELETNKEDLKIWTKMNSKYQKNCPFLKTHLTIMLEPTDDINAEKIMQALYEPEKRKIWDDSVMFFENFDYNEAKNTCISYMVTKIPFLANKDFVEKRAVFKDLKNKEDVCVYWQIEDERYPKKPNLNRAFTRIGGTFVKASENQIDIWTLSQVDTDMKAFGNVLKKMLPKNVEKWFMGLKNFLKLKKTD